MNLLWWPMIRISFYRITLRFTNKRSWAISGKTFEKARVDQIINSPSKNWLHRQRDDKYLYQADNLTFKALFKFSNVLFTEYLSIFLSGCRQREEDHKKLVCLLKFLNGTVFLLLETLFDANYRDNKSKNRNFPVPRKVSRDIFPKISFFLV